MAWRCSSPGAVLENVIGRAWFAAVFAVSGVGGALMSLLINPQSLISVGASGAIMGLFAAAFSVSYRYAPGSPMRGFLQSGSLRILIPSLILPLFDGLFGQRIDFAAHIGGSNRRGLDRSAADRCVAPAGTVAALQEFAWTLAAHGICGVIYSGTQIANGYAEYNLSSRLIPEEQIPKTAASGKEEVCAPRRGLPGGSALAHVPRSGTDGCRRCSGRRRGMAGGLC